MPCVNVDVISLGVLFNEFTVFISSCLNYSVTCSVFDHRAKVLSYLSFGVILTIIVLRVLF